MTDEFSERAGRAERPSPGPGATEVDILGIGFGPANLALAIAIEESNRTLPPGERVTAHFFETKPRFRWHEGMLLPEATMQISFLKDLVSARTPTSPFSFLNFLHERNRLTDFINLKTFFPTRQEFHDYLCWAAERVSVPVSYGMSATRIDRREGRFAVTALPSGGAEPETVAARNVVMGMGIQPSLPAGIAPGPRVFHNHELLFRLAEVPSRPHRRFLVVGAGQSAAEVVAYLHETYRDAEVHASFRRFGYLPADDTPYANRIFDPSSVDDFYTAPPNIRQRLLKDHWFTNYSAVDAELINALYRREYDETVRGAKRLHMHRVTDVADLRAGDDGVSVTLRDLGDRHRTRLEVDATIFATGFRTPDLREMFGPDMDCQDAFEDGLPVVERNYCLRLPRASGRIYLNGGVQHSHGLTSSLLSNVAIRADEILGAVKSDLPPISPRERVS